MFDTRMFHDAGSRKHVGSNDEIVDGIVQRRLACRLRRCPARFPQFLDSLWYAWLMINRQISKGSQVRIVMYCKSGRHTALVAHHLFETTRGFPPVHAVVGHLCPRNCRQCTQQSNIRDAALQKAREMWKELLKQKEQ